MTVATAWVEGLLRDECCLQSVTAAWHYASTAAGTACAATAATWPAFCAETESLNPGTCIMSVCTLQGKSNVAGF